MAITMALHFEYQYWQALRRVLTEGVASGDRTGTGTRRVQHAYFELGLAEGLPILAGKKLMPKLALVEAAWMMAGKTNTKDLKKHGVNYWDAWANEDGDLGPVYGAQIRSFGPMYSMARPSVPSYIDQLGRALGDIVVKPNSRQIVVSLWNPGELSKMALPPCHVMYQFCVVDGELSMHVFQRSADAFLGVPYDFLLFSYMLIFAAEYTHTKPGKIHYTCGDFHIYNNHVEQVEQYLLNVYEDPKHLAGPINRLGHVVPIHFSDLGFATAFKATNYRDWWTLLEAYNFDVFAFDRYKSYPFIKAPLAV